MALGFDEEKFALPEKGKTYGRCGGRPLHSPLEHRVCDRLSRLGIAHSHSPRRYEIRIARDKVAAYSPCIVLRGRGREGKTAMIQVVSSMDETMIKKIEAFRSLYNAEFYVMLVAPGSILNRIPPSCYDEALLPTEFDSLAMRLAEQG
ncbi:MAG: hypothetical protein ACE5F1_17950 [Planctomycetota bacterium]